MSYALTKTTWCITVNFGSILCILAVTLKICKEGGLKWIYHLLQCAEQSQIITEGLIALNIIVIVHGGKHCANATKL